MQVLVLNYILMAVGAYLLGSIPTGFLVARSRGIDIRGVGSGNIGATNVFRVVGKAAGIFVLLTDVLKGFVACAFLCPLIFNWLAPHYSGFYQYFRQIPEAVQIRFQVAAGISAIVGHNFSCWLKFKGGKGVATSAGVFLALAPAATAVALGVWIIALALTRYVSVASISAAVALPAATCVFAFVHHGDGETQGDLILQIVTIAAGLMVIIKHRSNIQRLRSGTEKQITFKRTEAAK